MERHIQYLELRLARCMARPELHRHQIPALHELIALARAATSPEDYNRRAGHLFALTRAEWLDRHDNAARVYAAVGDERMSRVTSTLRRAGDATNFAELSAMMTRAMVDSGALRVAAATAAESVAPLVISLLHWQTEGNERTRAAIAATLRGLWRAIQQADPGCDWQRICTYPAYRHRLPFHDDGLALIGSWLERAVGTQLAGVPDPEPHDSVPLPVVDTPDDPPLPSVADVARGYHLAHEAAVDRGETRVRAVYERIFEHESAATCANDFLARVTADDLDCELNRAHHAEMAEAALAHCASLSQPHVEYHYLSLTAALARCKSPTEIDYELTRHETCFAIETAWNHVLLAYAFRTITAVLGYELRPTDDQRATVRNSYRVARQLFGDWEALVSMPRVRSFFDRLFFERGQELMEPPAFDGIYRGEVGLEVFLAFRDHALQHVVELVAGRDIEGDAFDDEVQHLVNSRRFATADAMRDHATDLFRAATGEAVGAAKKSPDRGVILWGQTVLFETLEGALSSPPRPC